MSIKERVLKIVNEKHGGNVYQFEKTIGLSNGYVKNIQDNIRPRTIDLILKKYPDINRKWLILGEGEMYTENSETNSEKINSSLSETFLEQLQKLSESSNLQIRLLEKLISEKEEEIKRLRHIIDKKDQVISDRDQTIKDKDLFILDMQKSGKLQKTPLP